MMSKGVKFSIIYWLGSDDDDMSDEGSEDTLANSHRERAGEQTQRYSVHPGGIKTTVYKFMLLLFTM